VLVLGVIGAAGAAFGSDGVIEINAARAAAGNVTPGDLPGLPVTISLAGSYRLTSNLVQPDAATRILAVTANNVSIDLGGFELSGPFNCPGTPASCASVGLGYAVDGNATSGLTIRNGKVRGTARGLFLGDGCSVHDVTVSETTNFGVFGGEFCTVRGVVSTRNGASGIQLDSGTIVDSTAGENETTGISFGNTGTVTSSSARGNGTSGITGNAGTQVSGCNTSGNTLHGISLNAGGVVTSSTAYNNTGDGIHVAAGSLVRHSTAYSNTGDGIEAGAGSQVFANTARANTGFGLRLGDRAAYRENILTANNNGAEVQVGTVVALDVLVNLVSNVCGTDTVCP
jgi:hypothetical protein